MASKDFNPFGTSVIIVNFKCDQCQCEVEGDEIQIPSPNYAAENSSDSQVSEEESVVCPNCGKEYTIDIYVDINGGSVDIPELSNDYTFNITKIDSEEDNFQDNDVE